MLFTTAMAAEYPAVLDWSRRAVLSTPVSGIVASVSVVAGDRVTAGQDLLQLDQRPFESALADARAQARKYDLQREEARRELERTRELYERTVISVHDLQLGEIAAASAQADYSSAVAALDTARLQLEYSTLHAPFDGRVLAVDVTVGMTVINTQQATPLVTLAQDRPMHAQVRVDAGTLPGLTAGQAVMVSVRGKRYPGRIDHLGAEPDASGQYTLTVAFDPGERALRAGLPASVALER